MIGSVAHRTASAARMAATTAATVCSNVFPSVWTMERVVGRPEWGDRAVPIEIVAPLQVGQDSVRLRRALGEAALLGSTPGPFLGRHVEKDLQVGIGQDHGPDVAPGHHDPAPVGERPLAGEQCGADLRHSGHLAHGAVDLGSADLGRDVDAVDQHP